MNPKKSLIALAALVGIATIPAQGFAFPPRPGGYLSVFLGASAPQDATVTSNEFNPVSTKNSLVQFDPGINAGGTAGYDFGFLRLEGEMSYKQGAINSVSEPTFGARYVNVDGRAEAFALMMNGFFDLHNPSPVTPYFGGGIGVASVNLSDTRGVDATNGVLNNHIFSSDSDNVFAYQAGVGLELALTRRISFDLGYRYFGTNRANFRKDWPNNSTLTLESHNATAGIRFKF